MKRAAKYSILFSVLVGSLIISPGCSDQVKYHAGLVTGSVAGKILLDPDLGKEHIFILVQEHHRTFIKTSEGYLIRISASVAHPDENGYYSIPFAAEVVRLDLRVVARGYQVVFFSFNRTLGIGRYEYNKTLTRAPNWRDSFFLLIKPVLSEYITEERYLMKRFDQLFLGNWLSETEDLLNFQH